MVYDPERIVNMGELEKRGKTVRFGIKEKDRSRHIYVIGQTGTGKSTLLEMLAMQDIHNGTGLIFLDPHGQSVDNLLQYVTSEQIDNTIYFAPHLQEKPIGLNIMEDIGYDKRHLVVSSLMASFEKIWGAATWSDRMAYILSNTLLALIEYPGTTLLDVGRMYTSKSFREKVVANLKDPQVKKYWEEEFANYTERYAQEATPSIQNKIGQFTSNPLMRNIIGQKKSAFDFRKIMDEGRMLLVNLSKGQIGENNARMLGVLFTTKIYLAALSRSDMAKSELEQANPCNFFVDEFQSFANSSFSDILSEARKYKLNLVLAHQYLGQLYTDDTGGGNAIRDAVFGNVGTFVSFRVGPVDAEIISKQFAPYVTEEDLVALPRYHVYLTLNIDGAGSAPFSARTFYEPAHEEDSQEDEVIKRTMDTYGIDRDVVEEEVRKNLEEDISEKQKGKKGSGKKQSGVGQHVQGRGSQKQREGKEVQKTHMPLKGLIQRIQAFGGETDKSLEPDLSKGQKGSHEEKGSKAVMPQKVAPPPPVFKDELFQKKEKTLLGKMFSTNNDKSDREGQQPQSEVQKNAEAETNPEVVKQGSDSNLQKGGERQQRKEQKKEKVMAAGARNAVQGTQRRAQDRQPGRNGGRKNRRNRPPNQSSGRVRDSIQSQGNERRERSSKYRDAGGSRDSGKNAPPQQLQPQSRVDGQQSRQQDKKAGGKLGDLIQSAKSASFQKDLKVKPKKEKKSPPIDYDEGWVSIGDISKSKQEQEVKQS